MATSYAKATPMRVSATRTLCYDHRWSCTVIATAPIAIVPAHTEPPPSLGRQTPTCACQPRTINPHNRPYARDAILATTLARSATIYA